MSLADALHWARCLLPLLAPLVPAVVGLRRWAALDRIGRRVVVLAGGAFLLQGASLAVIYLLGWTSNYGVERLLIAFLAVLTCELLAGGLPLRHRRLARGLLWASLGLAGLLWWARPPQLLDGGVLLLMSYRLGLSVQVLLLLLRFQSWHAQAGRLLVAAGAILVDAGVNLLVYAFFRWTASAAPVLGYSMLTLASTATTLCFLLLLRCVRPGDPLDRRRRS